MEFPSVRRVLAATAVSAALATATASPSAAAQPVVLDSCAVTVQGEPGQLVSLKPAAVAPQLLAALAPLDPLNVLRPAFTGIWQALPPITLGSIGAADGLIPGSAVADAVLGELRRISLLAPVVDALSPTVRAMLGANCGVRTKPGTPVPAPAPPSSPPSGGHRPPATGGTPPATAPAAPAATGPTVTSPGLPEAVLGAQFPGAVGPGGIPGPGIPPDRVAYDYGPAAVPQVPAVDARMQGLGGQATGSAQALPAASHGGIGRSTLLAGLLVTLVGTQLFRRWALRRAAKTD
ncbi:hypothetical protein DMA12_01055 [Amycolatopsis balhimycina DSM 5908]|uniref:Uncharacterized protein n=1 Tax=Amycolatopsis balhimycina DSM 5908 TaxID=1081091 RepID=A0A428X619_AMYBA|nr:hypothetical protein [Amycolatopsis balhimycina]RSM50771.1 hypothetical protein DMA12_01055 [Amycolatopsis balhimycina DSM 5908]